MANSVTFQDKTTRSRPQPYHWFAVGNYMVFYVVFDDVMEVRRFIYGARDLTIILFTYHTECTLRESGEPFGISGMETQVAVREDEGWRLLHVHYSIAQ